MYHVSCVWLMKYFLLIFTSQFVVCVFDYADSCIIKHVDDVELYNHMHVFSKIICA